MSTKMTTQNIAERVEAVDWRSIATDLDVQGWAILPKLLCQVECDAIAGLYGEGDTFRSHIIMARHGFGRGEYRYFAYPLPPLVEGLRAALYPHLAPAANRWHERMGIDARFPTDHAAFIERCHAAGQTRPTPLLLQYGRGTTTACTRTSMASTSSRFRSRSCSRSLAKISRAASSCSRSSARVCNLAPPSCRSRKAMLSPSR